MLVFEEEVENDELFYTEDIYHDDKYAIEYGEEFTEKIKHLQDIIINGNTKPSEFNVFALEAGLGKSKYTTKIIDDNLYDFSMQRTFLVVKRFKEDVDEMERVLSKHNESKLRVLGITAENWGEWRERPDELANIAVLIITHKRYIDLCLDDELRQYFTENREVLIIDEKVNFPIYSFSRDYYDKIRSMLPSHRIQKEFDKVCDKLLLCAEKEKIRKHLNLCVRIEPKIHPATVGNFLNLMEVTLDDIKRQDHKNAVKFFLEGIELWYTTLCVYNGGNITTFNRKHMLWGLQNNIILDASSSIDGVYMVSKNYHVIGESRIIDHSASSFNVIPFNTSKSNLQEYEREFYPEVAEKIKTHSSEGKGKTLIVCHKDNYKKIYHELLKIGINDNHIANETTLDDEVKNEGKITQQYAINWFGNLIGKNAYGEFSQCWIIATPNIPYEQYLMHYMMYARKKNLGNKPLDIEKGRFNNVEFYMVQTGYIASEIYQSIKRIQRNVKPEGEFFIINHDNDIIGKVLNQIKGSSNKNVILLDFMEEKKKMGKSDNVDKFIQYVRYSLPVGEHPKKYIAEELEIAQLYRVLNSDRVQALVEHEFLKINHHTIEKLKEW
jgi:hypothetical protein